MDSTNDIKVTFLNNEKRIETEKIRVFFKDIFGNDIQIDLRPGEVVYSQTDNMSNSLKIYSRKGVIDIQKENKPNYLKYYVGYKEEEIDNKYFLFNLQNSLNNEQEQSVSEKKKSAKKENISKSQIIESIVEKTSEKIIEESVIEKTILEKAIEDVEKYSVPVKKNYKRKKGPGRPKKRGPKKGAKKRKTGE